MTIENINALFEHMLQDIYYVEKCLIDALKKMENASSEEKLAESFREHCQQTEKHVERLKKYSKTSILRLAKKNAKALKA